MALLRKSRRPLHCRQGENPIRAALHTEEKDVFRSEELDVTCFIRTNEYRHTYTAGKHAVPVTKKILRQQQKKSTGKKLLPLASIDISDKIQSAFRINEVVQRTIEVLGDSEQAKQWLAEPKTIFQGRSPLEYAETETGAEFVLDILGRIEYGVFS